MRIGWLSAAGLLGVSIFLGFVLLGRPQQNGPALSPWSAFCSALGISPDVGPADEPQPPLRTPSRIAWTRETLTLIAGGDPKQGAFVAMNCTACHGEQGVSSSGLYPTLAGMDAAAIYKQLDDYRAGKRSWGAMNGIAQALSQQASADVAAVLEPELLEMLIILLSADVDTAWKSRSAYQFCSSPPLVMFRGEGWDLPVQDGDVRAKSGAMGKASVQPCPQM